MPISKNPKHTHLLRQLSISAALVLAASGSAHAVEYTAVDTANSSVTFSYQQMGVNMDGSFSTLEAPQFSFDPANPANASVVLQIPLAGIDVGTAEANAEVEKGEWLNTPAHPLASFKSSKVEALGDNRYQLTGELAIKGKTQTVATPFTLEEKDGAAFFMGTFTLKRADFDVGEGDWSDFSIVANDIKIAFKLSARP